MKRLHSLLAALAERREARAGMLSVLAGAGAELAANDAVKRAFLGL